MFVVLYSVSFRVSTNMFSQRRADLECYGELVPELMLGLRRLHMIAQQRYACRQLIPKRQKKLAQRNSRVASQLSTNQVIGCLW